MKFIIYPQADNKLAMIVPADPSLAIEAIAAKDVPAGVPFSIVDDLAINERFFDAYEYADGAAIFMAEKGRQIQINRWRQARTPKLAALDVAYIRADEQGDAAAKAEIAAAKQALRNVTQTPIPGETPEEIEAVWSEILN